MHASILNARYTIKSIPIVDRRPSELAENMKPHPLSFMELPFDPEYSLYNRRMTPERLNNVSDDEQYWAVRQKVIFRNTGEFPVEISGPDAEKFANYIFARDISRLKVGRCSYNFALYNNGHIITDGVLLRFAQDRFWMVQADGELMTWYMAHLGLFDVNISDPNVWVTQIQGPKSMDLLSDVISGEFPVSWRYFDLCEVNIAGEKVIITRTGFSNELGWEIYLSPQNDVEKIGNAIWAAGQKYGIILAGTPVFRARRIEAGLLSMADFVNCNPYEAGLGHFLNMDKTDFIGRNALQNVDKTSYTFGMRVRGGIAKHGKTLMSNGEVIGSVASSTWSPFQECGVAIVKLNNLETALGAEVEVVGIDGETYGAKICSLPMYDPEGTIVRGKNCNIPEGPNPWMG